MVLPEPGHQVADQIRWLIGEHSAHDFDGYRIHGQDALVPEWIHEIVDHGHGVCCLPPKPNQCLGNPRIVVFSQMGNELVSDPVADQVGQAIARVNPEWLFDICQVVQNFAAPDGEHRAHNGRQLAE